MAVTMITDIPKSIRDVYSKEILYFAQPKLRFAQFAKKKTDLLTQPGQSIAFTKFNNISEGGKLAEDTEMDEKKITDTEVKISVDEYGNAVAVSEKSLQLSLHNILAEAAQLLANDLAIVLDKAIRDVALSTTNIIYGGQRAASADLVSGDAFNTTVIKDAAEALSNNNAPKVDGQYYICIAHPHQLRQIRDDQDWINVHNYQGVDNIFKGEVGMYEGVRFIDTTQMPANSAAASQAKYGVNIKTWEAVIFGENAFGWAEALEVEMRTSAVRDYGRKHGLAWYAIWGFGLIEEKNIFKIITA